MNLRLALCGAMVPLSVAALLACSSAKSPAARATAHGVDGGLGGAPGNHAWTISPTTAQASFGGRVQFSVVGSPATAATWTVEEGSAGGTVSATGLYEAPSSSGTFHITATSMSDPSMTATGSVTVTAPRGTPPVLTPGTWTDITPPGLVLLEKNYGSPLVEIDPSNPRTLYLCVDQSGMWKTTDGGSSWARLGDQSAPSTETETSYLDSPISVRVDPHDSLHLYATQGVRGNTMGFWASSDGGDTWAWPPGYAAIVKTVGTSDVTQFDVDPTDFNHVLLGSHSPWKGLVNAGLLETKDGGNSWVAHQPMASWTPGSMGVHFLYAPDLGLGNSQTWFAGEAKFWRTTDSGTTWTSVATFGVTHGGNDIYYTKAGILYAGATPYPVRSSDNGVTWEQLTNGPGFSYYYSVQGDGTTLYTQHANTGTNSGTFTLAGATPSPYIVSPEADGSTWTPYKGGTQTFIDGPFSMRFDPGNRIMYSANWDAGLWALKVE